MYSVSVLGAWEIVQATSMAGQNISHPCARATINHSDDLMAQDDKIQRKDMAGEERKKRESNKVV